MKSYIQQIPFFILCIFTLNPTHFFKKTPSSGTKRKLIISLIFHWRCILVMFVSDNVLSMEQCGILHLELLMRSTVQE